MILMVKKKIERVCDCALIVSMNCVTVCLRSSVLTSKDWSYLVMLIVFDCSS